MNSLCDTSQVICFVLESVAKVDASWQWAVNDYFSLAIVDEFAHLPRFKLK